MTFAMRIFLVGCTMSSSSSEPIFGAVFGDFETAPSTISSAELSLSEPKVGLFRFLGFDFSGDGDWGLSGFLGGSVSLSSSLSKRAVI